MNNRLPAEWENQDAVLLPWPHPATDWAHMLDDVVPVFVDIARAISRFQTLIIIAPEISGLQPLLEKKRINTDNVEILQVATNDTWARDYGPITTYVDGRAIPLDFTFNGWGGKYPAELDNHVTQELACLGRFKNGSSRTINMVLEGGSIDTDGKGTILTTRNCLLNPNRNPEMSEIEVEQALAAHLGATRVHWLGSGMLQGDDTDSHVDILARFAPNDTILHITCNDRDDLHFSELAAMERELESFRREDGQPYRLLPLPMTAARYNSTGERLGATYANFLVINGAVLVPVYDDPADEEACRQIGKAFPGRDIIPINCLPLIEQGGSLHCSTMQLPQGVLR